MTAYADIDLDAVTTNAATLSRMAGTALCAVVKAGGYGHGASDVAGAALAGGASWLAVATLTEAATLASDFPDTPVLVLSERPVHRMVETGQGLPETVRFTVGSVAGATALEQLGRPVRVHLKVDTGMRRMGADPAEVVTVADAIVDRGHDLEGVWTHFADADVEDQTFTNEQLARFEAARDALRSAGHQPRLAHAANSAATIAVPDARLDLVRTGIALYGIAPSPHLESAADLRPALRLHSTVTALRELSEGDTVSYGRRWRAAAPTVIATVPVGYADGIRRSSGSAGVEVLVGGVRRAIVGNVTMDQLMVEVDSVVSVGDEVVLIGDQGDEAITANEVAGRLGTIGYEVVTALGSRIVRRIR